ncbi:hypothetical protein GCM10023354_17960 [Garicola koreensis]|uniref:hypothetical protein n=1 Tax=Garicola koreensis TaxID=1262554 RepID=UPI0031F136C1
MDSGAVELLHEVHAPAQAHIGSEILIVDIVPDPPAVAGVYALFGEVLGLLREVRRVVFDVSAGVDGDGFCAVVAVFDGADLFEVFVGDSAALDGPERFRLVTLGAEQVDGSVWVLGDGELGDASFVEGLFQVWQMILRTGILGHQVCFQPADADVAMPLFQLCSAGMVVHRGGDHVSGVVGFGLVVAGVELGEFGTADLVAAPIIDQSLIGGYADFAVAACDLEVSASSTARWGLMESRRPKPLWSITATSSPA